MYKLYIKQKVFKITDHYPIFNEAREEVYQVDQDFKLIGNRIRVAKKDGTKSFVLNKLLFRIPPQYEVVFNDGKSFLIKQNFRLFKKDIDLISDDYNLELTGNLWDLNFDVKYQGKVVGHIDKIWLAWGDTYEITVFDPSFEEELVALFIAVDAIKDDERDAASRVHADD